MFLTKYFHLKVAAISFLVLGLFGFYFVSIVSMDHSGMDVSNIDCTYMTNQAMNSTANNICLGYHLGLLDQLGVSVSNHFSVRFLLVALLFVLSAIIQNLTNLLAVFYNRLRIYRNLLYEKIILAFFAQLGFWLTLFEKRDPAEIFTMV